MTNMIIRKNLKCIKWIVQVTSGNSLISKPFTFQDCKCHLECSINLYDQFTDNYSSILRFKSEGLQLPLNIVVRVHTSSGILSAQTNCIKNTNEPIWRYNGQLSISLFTFEIVFFADSSEDEKSTQISSYEDPCFSVEGLSHDFSKLLDEGPNHDAEFTCGDQIIKAHKSILSCRSNVFASMLQSDMMEGKTGRVTIQDIDSTIFKQFLKVVYTGMLPELTVDSACQLYEIADKYGVNAVKKQCADFLTDNLSSENVCEILVLSDRHSDADFKKKVIEFVIKENIPFIGQKWTDFCKVNLALANEVLNLFCQHLRPK